MNKVQQEEVLRYCIVHNISFAVYNLPNNNQSRLIISKETHNISLKKALVSDGFVLAPFVMQNEKVLFLNKDYEVGEKVSEIEFELIRQQSISKVHEEEDNYIADFNAYAKQFEVLMDVITKGTLKKAILSKVKTNHSLTRECAAEFYYSLVKKYEQACVFMFYTPQSGLWAGASPELLFSASNGMVKTVSLAGTRKLDVMESVWKTKDIKEQEIVSDYLGDILQSFSIDDYHKDGPRSVKAGKMTHLKTNYQFNASLLGDRQASFIEELYPTPAVCGLPKQTAVDNILKIEQHKRTFYAGFFGRVQSKNVELYVNIRSLKFIKDGVNMYLGGGITKDSDVHEEWNETELKAKTMLDVIDSISNN